MHTTPKRRVNERRTMKSKQQRQMLEDKDRGTVQRRVHEREGVDGRRDSTPQENERGRRRGETKKAEERRAEKSTEEMAHSVREHRQSASQNAETDRDTCQRSRFHCSKFRFDSIKQIIDESAVCCCWLYRHGQERQGADPAHVGSSWPWSSSDELSSL